METMASACEWSTNLAGSIACSSASTLGFGELASIMCVLSSFTICGSVRLAISSSCVAPLRVRFRPACR